MPISINYTILKYDNDRFERNMFELVSPQKGEYNTVYRIEVGSVFFKKNLSLQILTDTTLNCLGGDEMHYQSYIPLKSLSSKLY